MLFFIICFALFSVFHLYCCYFHIEKLRMLTKPVLLLSLALFYLFAAQEMRVPVFIALLCGMVGDILLLWPKDTRFFMPGAFVFGAGHILYAYALLSRLASRGAQFEAWIPIAVMLPFIAEPAVTAALLMKHIDRPVMRPLMPLYLALVGAVNAASWLTLIDALRSGGNAFAPALMALGGLFFLASDTVLCKAVFKGEGPRTNFYVMLTYISAQLCLCLGFIKLV